MKSIFVSSVTVMLAIAISCFAIASGNSADGDAASELDIKMPDGYRDWTLITVAHEEGKLNDLRAILGNEVAVKAYREGIRPFPDGSIIVRLAWSYDPLEESSSAFGSPQSFVAGAAKNGVQFMIKNSTKYASTGGWRFAHFNNGKRADKAVHDTCFTCHQVARSRDFVFNRYSP